MRSKITNLPRKAFKILSMSGIECYNFVIKGFFTQKDKIKKNPGDLLLP